MWWCFNSLRRSTNCGAFSLWSGFHASKVDKVVHTFDCFSIYYWRRIHWCCWTTFVWLLVQACCIDRYGGSAMLRVFDGHSCSTTVNTVTAILRPNIVATFWNCSIRPLHLVAVSHLIEVVVSRIDKTELYCWSNSAWDTTASQYERVGRWGYTVLSIRHHSLPLQKCCWTSQSLKTFSLELALVHGDIRKDVGVHPKVDPTIDQHGCGGPQWDWHLCVTNIQNSSSAKMTLKSASHSCFWEWVSLFDFGGSDLLLSSIYSCRRSNLASRTILFPNRRQYGTDKEMFQLVRSLASSVSYGTNLVKPFL